MLYRCYKTASGNHCCNKRDLQRIITNYNEERYNTASGNHCCNTLANIGIVAYVKSESYKTASGNHCCNSTSIFFKASEYVTKPQAVITVATFSYSTSPSFPWVTKPQAVITVATAAPEALVQSGSFGVLWQTKSTFTKFSLKNAISSVLPQRPALKTLITQRLHDFGKPPQPLCLHPLQKRTTTSLYKVRSRNIQLASSKHVRQTAALSLPSHTFIIQHPSPLRKELKKQPCSPYGSARLPNFISFIFHFFFSFLRFLSAAYQPNGSSFIITNILAHFLPLT